MIQVELSTAEIPIDAGGTATLTVEVHNRQEHDDHVFLEIEGIDVEWYALPVPAVNIPSGGSQSARVLFKVPRASESRANSYPFLVRARGMETGEAGVQQATLVVKPFSSLQLELDPKRVTATFLRHATTLDVTITNLGNHDEVLDLYASDPEGACAYEFETDRVTVAAGRAETVPLFIEPVTRPVLGAMRLYGFNVTARSAEDSYVSTSRDGQIERRPLLSTLGATLLLFILLAAGAWAVWRPEPVLIRSFTAAPTEALAGDEVALAWDVANIGSDSFIDPGHLPVKATVGTVQVRPLQTTRYRLVARGRGGQADSYVTVSVKPRPAAPKPRIVSFGASVSARGEPRETVRVHQGDPVTLTWQVRDTTEIVLNPLGPTPKPATMYLSDTVKPDQTTTYILAAKGAGGDVATRKVTVYVVSPTESIAEIDYFRAKPGAVTAGQTSALSWRVQGASSIEIDNGVGGGLSPNGSFEVRPQETTIYTLRATDNRGNLRTKQVTVRVLPPPPPPQESAEPLPADDTGTGIQPSVSP